MRSLSSYTKVQTAVGSFIRNKKLFINEKELLPKSYLDVGCGPNLHPDFVNLEYQWRPGIDICWDITKKPYPFRDGRFAGIFTEHCLEHISFEDFHKNVAEFYRLLKPGGTVRIIMPDGEIYLDIYQRQKMGEDILMPWQSGYISPMARINGIFRKYGHQFIYDFETVRIILDGAGFKNIRKLGYKQGDDPNLLIDSEWRKDESLYIEAKK